MNLRFYLFVSGVNQGNEGREVNSRFPCVNPGVWGLSFSFITSEVAEFSACGVFVDD